MKCDVVDTVLLCVTAFLLGLILGASCDLSISVSSRSAPANSTAVEVESEENGDPGAENADMVAPAKPSTAASG